jgi:hypothetical protein
VTDPTSGRSIAGRRTKETGLVACININDHVSVRFRETTEVVWRVLLHDWQMGSLVSDRSPDTFMTSLLPKSSGTFLHATVTITLVSESLGLMSIS